jgi:hypothetical protein
MLKAISLGAILATTVALVVGSQGSDGGLLAIQTFRAGEARIYWSWPIFCVGSGLAWGLLLLQR